MEATDILAIERSGLLFEPHKAGYMMSWEQVFKGVHVWHCSYMIAETYVGPFPGRMLICLCVAMGFCRVTAHSRLWKVDVAKIKVMRPPSSMASVIFHDNSVGDPPSQLLMDC